MAPHPAAAEPESALLHCSPARTVWHRRPTQGGPELVVKVYVRGSLADAEREFAMGRLAHGPGVVAYVAVDTERDGSRPSVTTRHVPGTNLEALVAQRGAVPAAEACAVLAPVARTLARLHALRTPELPRGMCHGDLKPQNLLATDDDTLLLDFEHAGAIGAPPRADGGAPSSGATAFAPPEAANGAPPSAPGDVFGLGATLAYLLDGGAAQRLPQHSELGALLAACCARDPAARPDAAHVAARLAQLASALRGDPAEAALHDWASGAFERDPGPAPTADARVAAWRRRHRLAARLPRLFERPHGVPADPSGLADELQRVKRVLLRFPRHRATLRRRHELLTAVADLLARAAEHVHALAKAEQFDAAAQWLGATERLVGAAAALPGGLATVTRTTDATPPGQLQRAPIEFLQRLGERVAAARSELATHAARVTEAECALDLARAEREVDELAATYGGTSPTTAQRRDRLHRLGFYLDRIGRAAPNVERVAPLWDAVALQPLRELVRRATAASAHRARQEGGAVGLRSLQLTLANLAEEFPHLDPVPPALAALSQALVHLTDTAWQQLADAEQRLKVVPVPVRPLQLALGRLDTFRSLEAFVDRPERPRSALLDGLERLRLGFEQARAARDRLAENAELALARGHWTTGLFDMERAVAGLNPRDDHERAEAERLQERMQAARRTKQELESAVRRNVELIAEYAALEDDPASTFQARVRVLEERRDCLTFLTLRVPSERAVLYRQDLRGVDTQIAVERAGEAERRLDASSDPAERLRVVRDTLEQLAAAASAAEYGAEPPGRLVRLREHWQTLATQCQQAIDALHREQRARERRQRRLVAAAIAATLVAATAVAFALW